MERGDRQERPIGRERQGRDHRQPGVLGGMIHVVPRLGVLGHVIRGALGDPSADQLDLGGRQRRLVLGHLRLAVLGGDLVDEVAFIRLAGHDRWHVALATLEHPIEGRHHIGTASLGRLMATLALGLEDRADLPVVTDLRPRGRHRRTGRFLDLRLGLLFLIRGAGRDRPHQQDHQGPDPPTPFRHDLRHLGLLPCSDLRGRRSRSTFQVQSPGPADQRLTPGEAPGLSQSFR